MSQENVDLVREIYERFRAGDADGALELHDPDVEIRDRPEAPDPQVYRGREGVVRSLSVSQSTFEGLEILPEEFVDLGDDVMVVFRFVGTGRESRVPVDERLVHLWTIRDGRAFRMAVHSSRDDALAAVRRPPDQRGRGAATGSGGAGEP